MKKVQIAVITEIFGTKLSIKLAAVTGSLLLQKSITTLVSNKYMLVFKTVYLIFHPIRYETVLHSHEMPWLFHH